MVSALVPGSSGPGSRDRGIGSRVRGHCVVFLGKTLYSHSASRLSLASRPGGGEILLAALCYGNQDKLWPDEPVLAPKASLSLFTSANEKQQRPDSWRGCLYCKHLSYPRFLNLV